MSTNGTGAKKKRKSPDGVPTNDLVFSAYTGANDDVFPYILSLYSRPREYGGRRDVRKGSLLA